MPSSASLAWSTVMPRSFSSVAAESVVWRVPAAGITAPNIGARVTASSRLAMLQSMRPIERNAVAGLPAASKARSSASSAGREAIRLEAKRFFRLVLAVMLRAR